jgi:hypothetical protein
VVRVRHVADRVLEGGSHEVGRKLEGSERIVVGW